MAPESDPDLLVLHGVRLKSFASVPVLAELVNLPAPDVVGRLDRFADKGWARYREGVVTGWSLTPTGRAEAGRVVHEELAATGCQAAIEASYDAFLEHNRPFLQVCTDWQLRPIGSGQPVPNDHRDTAHDHGVIDRLREIDGAARLICADLHATLGRFGRYGERFGRALRHVESGQTDWFTKPVLDSYHTVWFELHEDLLVTLGRERSSEATG